MPAKFLIKLFIVMNRYSIVVLLALFLSLDSCLNSNADITDREGLSKSKLEHIPELKQRDKLYGPAEEYEKMRNIYDNAKKTIKSKPNNAIAKLRMAEVFIQEGRITGDFKHNYSSALLILDNIINSRNSNNDLLFLALTYKAGVLLSQHKFKDALTIGEKALKLNNRNAGIYGVLVDANVELGNYKEAVIMSDKMISIRPDLRSYSRVSYLREIHGDNKGAIEAMKLAVSAGYPGFEKTSWCRIILGGLYEKKGDLVNAEMQYRLALQERENYPYAMAALGKIEMKKTNYDEAEKLILQAIQFIGDADFYSNLSIIYKLKANYDKMNASIDQAFASLGETRPEHHHHHGNETTNMSLNITKICLIPMNIMTNMVIVMN